MSRPKHMTRWWVANIEGFGSGACWWVPSLRRWMTLEEARASGRTFRSVAPAKTRVQAERIAARMPDPTLAVVTLRSSRTSRKYPLGYERDFVSGRTP